MSWHYRLNIIIIIWSYLTLEFFSSSRRRGLKYSAENFWTKSVVLVNSSDSIHRTLRWIFDQKFSLLLRQIFGIHRIWTLNTSSVAFLNNPQRILFDAVYIIFRSSDFKIGSLFFLIFCWLVFLYFFLPCLFCSGSELGDSLHLQQSVGRKNILDPWKLRFFSMKLWVMFIPSKILSDSRIVSSGMLTKGSCK